LKKQKKNKIVFIVFGFSRKNLRKQPWFTVDQLLKKFVSNYDVNLITDSIDAHSNFYKTIKINKIFNFLSPSIKLKEIINELNPKKIFIIIGSHELLLFTRFRKFKNLNFIIGNNRFRIKEILRINLKDILSEYKLLLIPILASLLPGFLIKFGFKLIGKSKIVYLSREAQKRYLQVGLPKGKVFKPLKKVICRKTKFLQSQNKKIIITYFGPPLNLRGIDIVINTFECLSERKKNIFLNLLVRNNKEIYLRNKMIILKKIINNSKFNNNIKLDTNYYSFKNLQNKIKQSSIIILPFKITLSDTPLVIYEAIQTKKPLFVLDTPGITENIIKTNSYACDNERDLIYKILKFLEIK
tara:strand:+ start:408 stop:1472 length:1065 start_codon:yes stop_codon:yes gene_type:complete